MRRKIYQLPARYVPELLSGQWRATNLPDDAKLVYGYWKPSENAFEFVMESEKFDHVPEGAQTPTVAVEAETNT